MASGRKNYFRHSFFARDDIKLRLLRDGVGVGFYFYYFSLLEACGTECEYESKCEFEFHNSIIRSLWGVNLKKSERVACVMQSVGLLLFEKRDKSFYFKIDNFPKYLGKYSTKKETNRPNKIKENEMKLNKIKGKITESEIIVLFNDTLGQKGQIKKYPGFSFSPKLRDEFIILWGSGIFKDLNDMSGYFQEVGKHKKLLGQDEKFDFVASLPWLLKLDVAQKVLAGGFQSVLSEEEKNEELRKEIFGDE